MQEKEAQIKQLDEAAHETDGELKIKESQIQLPPGRGKQGKETAPGPLLELEEEPAREKPR